MNNNKQSNLRYTYFTSCSTPELEKLLRDDLQSNDDNALSIEEIRMITEILSKRNSENDSDLDFDPKTGWESFRNDYLPLAEQRDPLYQEPDSTAKKKGLYASFRYAAAILIICYVYFSVYSVTTVAEGIFSQFASWTNDNFWFGDAHINEADVGDANYEIDISEYFENISIPDNLLPTWLPPEYMLFGEEGYSNATENSYQYLFRSEDDFSTLKLKISYYYEDIEEDKTYNKPISTHEKDGILYSFSENNNTNAVTWKNGSFVCLIEGTITQETLMEIVESIPEQ